MKVLVTGAGGFIGSHLTELLVEKGYEVRALVRYNSQSSWGQLEHLDARKEVEVVSGDIRDFDSVKKAMKGVERVWHLAALISIPYSYEVQRAYVDVNMSGTLNILQAALDCGVRRVVHTSTSEVYGTAQTVPMAESHPINPQSPYAATKAGADYLALTFQKSFALPVVVVRPFNTYGPRQSARAIIPTIITQMLSGERSIRLGSLDPTRDLTYVKDTARGFLMAGAASEKKVAGEVINLGSNHETSVRDLVSMLKKITGSGANVVAEAKRKRPKLSEVERLWCDNRRAAKAMGWKPEYGLREGLVETVGWFRENRDLYKTGLYHV